MCAGTVPVAAVACGSLASAGGKIVANFVSGKDWSEGVGSAAIICGLGGALGYAGSKAVRGVASSNVGKRVAARVSKFGSRAAPRGVLDAASIGTRPATEVATAVRLVNHPEFAGRTLSGSSHVGADFVDDLGRTFDALGTPSASQYWNQQEFLKSIDSHVLKSNDFTVVDLTGFTPQQVAVVDSHIASLSAEAQATIIRLGP